MEQHREGLESAKGPKFAALTTDADIEKIINQRIAAALAKSGKSQSNQNNKSSEIAEWRKTKSFGDTVQKDDKTWYWCSQHQDGKGLYVTHKPEEHGQQKRGPNDSSGKGSGSNSSSSKSNSDTKMQLKDSLKAVLMTHGMTSDQAESICQDCKSSGSGQDFW